MPRVSVIIPAYNQAQYLGEAIQSVLHQRYSDYEIIVVDDGSTDNTREVAARFARQIRYIWQENKGLAGARNTGIRAARGELIGLLDSDDQWLPAFLAEMTTLADQRPEAAVYYCGAQCMDENGRLLPQSVGLAATPLDGPDALYQTLLRANFIIPSTTVLRRSAVTSAGLFDQKLRSCEDWDLWLRILPARQFASLPALLARYRVHGSSLSADPAGMQQAKSAVVQKHFGPDDRQPDEWSADKRRAYAGLYRYYALIFIQRQNDWPAATRYLRRALQIDATLSADLSLFYELALGAQPVGYRGAPARVDLAANAGHINRLLAGIFAPPAGEQLALLRRPTWGTAYYALGLAAYNTGDVSLSRRFFLRALRFRPGLWRHKLLVGNLVKSLAGSAALNNLRRLRARSK